jgi:hypothetical protein
LLNQVNYALLHLHLAGKHDAKPSHEELKDWLHSGHVDVIRMNKLLHITPHNFFFSFRITKVATSCPRKPYF